MSKVRLKLRFNKKFYTVYKIVSELDIPTVCEDALCPNITECWGSGTATFMIMGHICTRGCRFCYVLKGKPNPLDPDEPYKVAYAVKKLGLDYVTITSVDRDDLPDGGASHFAETIKAIKSLNPDVKVEVLIPDFQGDVNSLNKVLEAVPDVLAHNVETVERLTPIVRDRRASYSQSLKVLSYAKNRGFITKSSILLGFGESFEEIMDTIKDLVSIKLDILVLSQYMRPSSKHLPVLKYYSIEEFKTLEKEAYKLGIKSVVSHPLARTSYKAKEAYLKAVNTSINNTMKSD